MISHAPYLSLVTRVPLVGSSVPSSRSSPSFSMVRSRS